MVWCVLSVIALCSPSLAAQTAISRGLSDDTIRREPLTPEDKIQIVNFVEANLPLIETGSAKEMKEGKEALQEAARTPDASPSFRRFFSQSLLGRLNTMALGEESNRSVVAILIIGDLGTPQAVRALDDYLELDRNAQRFAAAVAYRSAFQGMKNPQNLIVGQAGAMLQNMGRLIEKDETNPIVLDVCMRATVAAADVGIKAGLPMGNLALDQLITSISARVQGLTTSEADAALFAPCVKATQELRGIVTLLAAQERADPAILRKSGGLCGDLFGYVFRRVRQSKLPVVGPGVDLAAVREARKNEISAMKVADRLVRLCKDELKVGDLNAAPVQLTPHINQGTKQGDRQFVQEVMNIVGDGGLLTQTGFRFDPARFLGGG